MPKLTSKSMNEINLNLEIYKLLTTPFDHQRISESVKKNVKIRSILWVPYNKN